MIDYRADAVALEQLRQSIAATTFPEPALASKKSQTLTDLAKAGDYALLGSFIDHLIAHAASDGVEIALLQRGADLWKRGVDMCNTLGQIRRDLETALDNPSDPGAPAMFNNAAMNAQQWAASLNNIEAEVVSLQNDVDPMPHLPPHPRQADKPTSQWDWLNLMMGRRTDAFVRNVAKEGKDEATNAFAFGVMANYGANAAGSAYLGQCVGGPRRSHRYRDRLARNAAGSWMAAHHPGIGSLTQMSQRLRFGHPLHPSLPPRIMKQLKKALAATFDETKTLPVPDLQIGYQRLLTHLELLDQFVMPAAPTLPSGGWTLKLYGDPTTLTASIIPQDIGVSGDPGGGVSVGNQPGSSQPGSDDSQKSSGGCGIGWLILAALLLVAAFIGCVVQWAQGKKCNYFSDLGDLITGAGRKDPPDPRDPPTQENPGMTSQGLTAFAPTEQATQMVAHFYELHARMWEALNKSYNYFAVTGMIYPDGLLDLPRFKQFVKLPAPTNWPHRPEPKPLLTYHLFPTSPLEHPLAQASPYATGSTPDIPAATTGLAVRISSQLWRQITLAEQDSQNLDLDADRGFDHPCWAAKKSVNDDPIAVTTLAYKDQ